VEYPTAIISNPSVYYSIPRSELQYLISYASTEQRCCSLNAGPVYLSIAVDCHGSQADPSPIHPSDPIQSNHNATHPITLPPHSFPSRSALSARSSPLPLSRSLTTISPTNRRTLARPTPTRQAVHPASSPATTSRLYATSFPSLSISASPASISSATLAWLRALLSSSPGRLKMGKGRFGCDFCEDAMLRVKVVWSARRVDNWVSGRVSEDRSARVVDWREAVVVRNVERGVEGVMEGGECRAV
jgi:hypothetical protein